MLEHICDHVHNRDSHPTRSVYKIDAKTFDVMDSLTYVADLDDAEEWGEEGPVSEAAP